MSDFKIMERSLKIKVAWIKRIAESSNASWKIIPNQVISQYGGLQFPEFYHAILNHWHDFRRLTCDKKISMKEQIIWNNPNTCSDGKPIYIKSWCINGIRCTEDLINVNLKFRALSEMKEKYNFKFPSATYYGLLRAIPAEWKSSLRVTASEDGESQKCETSLKLFSAKEAYYTILHKSFSAAAAEGRILNHGFTKEEIPNIYMLPFKILKEPKLIMFQVKIIQIILPTQCSLFHAHITDSDVCQ